MEDGNAIFSPLEEVYALLLSELADTATILYKCGSSHF